MSADVIYGFINEKNGKKLYDPLAVRAFWSTDACGTSSPDTINVIVSLVCMGFEGDFAEVVDRDVF